MKKYFLLLLLFILVFPRSTVFADNSSASATVSPVMTNNYTLPYPGILPDNPLYIFKTARDYIVAFFISDPLKKSAFDLLQSDKRLAASWYLISEGQTKDDIALTTLSKSTNYLSEAIDSVNAAAKAGEDTSPEKQNIEDATVKHIATVEKILGNKGLSNRGEFQGELSRLQNIDNVVAEFSSQK